MFRLAIHIPDDAVSPPHYVARLLREVADQIIAKEKLEDAIYRKDTVVGHYRMTEER